MTKEGNRFAVVGAIVLALIAVIIAVFIWIIMNGDETRISERTDSDLISSLKCQTKHNEEAFFEYNNVQRVSHRIDVLFRNDKLDQLSYNYEGVFNSNDAATTAEAWLHADYNEYLGGHGVYSESLNPVFSVVKTKLRISLYAENNKLSNAVLPLFFLNGETIENLTEYNREEYKRMYEDKGFDCELND